MFLYKRKEKVSSPSSEHNIVASTSTAGRDKHLHAVMKEQRQNHQTDVLLHYGALVSHCALFLNLSADR